MHYWGAGARLKVKHSILANVPSMCHLIQSTLLIVDTVMRNQLALCLYTHPAVKYDGNVTGLISACV